MVLYLTDSWVLLCMHKGDTPSHFLSLSHTHTHTHTHTQFSGLTQKWICYYEIRIIQVGVILKQVESLLDPSNICQFKLFGANPKAGTFNTKKVFYLLLTTVTTKED